MALRLVSNERSASSSALTRRQCAGIAGYGNVPDTVGASNAANPDYRPTLYGRLAEDALGLRVLTRPTRTDPVEASGKRFTTKNMPTSKFERLYHSSASVRRVQRITASLTLSLSTARSSR